ncbi:MAG: hypothetical protein IMY85_09460, partial [Chloroflexi bacterium]|nr:hypothetical protein [Chloroflexota bacterium]
MPSIQNVVITRHRLLWGDKINLVILLVFQVLGVIVLVSVPILADNWLKIHTDLSLNERWVYLYLPYFLGLVFL